MSWESIEDTDFTQCVWVILYCMADMKGNTVEIFPEIHGYYKTEAEALAVWRHFPNKERYHMHKAYLQQVKEEYNGSH